MLGKPMTDTTPNYKDTISDLQSEFYRERMIQKAIPTMAKNEICQFLLFKMQQHFAMQDDNDLVTLFNIGVRTGLKTSRVPAILVCEPQLWQVLKGRSGPAVLDFGEIPLLAVEVQENRADYLLKKAEYALLEIPEVWMIDPSQGRIQIWTNPTSENGYEHQDFVGDELLVSTQFPELELSVSDILNPRPYAELMQEEVDLNVSYQDDYSLEWQQMTLARTEYEDLKEQYDKLEDILHNELQEKAILLELLEKSEIDLESELTPGEFAMLKDDLEARALKQENDDMVAEEGDHIGGDIETDESALEELLGDDSLNGDEINELIELT